MSICFPEFDGIASVRNFIRFLGLLGLLGLLDHFWGFWSTSGLLERYFAGFCVTINAIFIGSGSPEVLQKPQKCSRSPRSPRSPRILMKFLPDVGIVSTTVRLLANMSHIDGEALCRARLFTSKHIQFG